MRFKDVTVENSHLCTMLERDFNNRIAKVFRRENTIIIYSETDVISHASLSNTKRNIKKNEIKYTINKIMKAKINDVQIYKLQNGNIHIKKPLT